MRALNKWNMGVRKFAANEKRFDPISGLLVDKEQTAATDGRVLVTVSLPMMREEERRGGKPFILSQESAALVERSIPKPLKRLLKEVYVDSCKLEKKDSKGQAVRFDSKDIDVSQVVKIIPVDGKFPDVSKVIPSGDPAYVVEVNGEILGKLLSFLGKFSSGTTGVKLSFYGSEKGEDRLPIRLDAKNVDTQQVAIGVVMPLAKE